CVDPGRTIARTPKPRAIRSAVTCRPMNPVAPVTATVRFTPPISKTRHGHESTKARKTHGTVGFVFSCFRGRSRQRPLIDAVGFVASSAEAFDRLVDVAVVLEHPREFGAAIARARQLLLEAADQQRVNPGPAVFG